MEKITTATGKQFDCDYFNLNPGARQVNLRVLGTSLVQAVSVFGDPAETVKLHFDNQHLAKHTKVLAIIPEVDAIRIVLGRE